MIILSQNSIYSVLFLVLSFVSSSNIIFLLECEYISLIFIIIYVGAIAVLFLFVVMMLNIKINENNAYTKKIINQENKLVKIIQATIIMSSVSFITVALILGL